MTPPVLMSVQIASFLPRHPSWRFTGRRLRHCESANIFQPFRGNLRPSNSQENKTQQQVHQAGTEITSRIWTLCPPFVIKAMVTSQEISVLLPQSWLLHAENAGKIEKKCKKIIRIIRQVVHLEHLSLYNNLILVGQPYTAALIQ